MNDNVLLREDVDVNLTWDLSHLIKDNDAFEAKLKEIENLVSGIETNFLGKINTAQDVVDVLNAYENYYLKRIPVGTFVNLAASVNMMDAEILTRYERFSTLNATWDSRLSFVDSALIETDETILKSAITLDNHLKGYIEDVLRAKPYALHPEAERALKSLSNAFSAPYDIYGKAKFSDLDYEPIVVEGKSYPMSFVTFENNYESERDTVFRRAAFKEFSNGLRKYQNTMASTLTTQMQREKAEATLRGYDSVFDYLLFDHKVTKDMYHRQIDIIIEKLAPAMRKYVNILAEINGLDKVTFADLKIAVDYDYEPSITIEESKDYILGALSIYGEDYTHMLNRAYDERWIDFVNNKGKRSGAFCSSPYGVHPYILITWSSKMEEVFVLAHELGHAGHFSLAQKNQSIFDCRASMYFIEAPSTINELLMANYLKKKNPDDIRFKRWVLSSMISRTYYHNFVTHLLEAHFQREVYKIIDQGGSVQASDLNRLKKATLQKFWGDTVDLSENAELTWMRQPHYYMGLYPYTYSAGLTVSTAVNKRIENEGEAALDDWKNVLKAGGTKTPLELAKMAGVDISTEKPLLDTIDFISGMVDEIEEISKTLGDIK